MRSMTRGISELRVREAQRAGCLGSLGGIEVDVLMSNSGDVAQLVDERTHLRSEKQQTEAEGE
jgi:hypothetical protein